MSKPHIVLVPGGIHTPVCYSLVTPKLEAAGYTVHCSPLPSVGADVAPKDLSQDIAMIREQVTQAMGADGNDIVVVCHSWSGIVVGSALDGLGKREREAQGKKGGVVHGAYIAAFMVEKGVSLVDVMDGKPADWVQVDGEFAYADPQTGPHALYSELPKAEQQSWCAQTRSHSVATLIAPATGQSWMEIPSSYLVCEDDLAFPPSKQELLAQKAIERGADVSVERIKSGHSPFLSQVDKLVRWIQKAAGETL